MDLPFLFCLLMVLVIVGCVTFKHREQRRNEPGTFPKIFLDRVRPFAEEHRAEIRPSAFLKAVGGRPVWRLQRFSTPAYLESRVDTSKTEFEEIKKFLPFHALEVAREEGDDRRRILFRDDPYWILLVERRSPNGPWTPELLQLRDHTPITILRTTKGSIMEQRYFFETWHSFGICSDWHLDEKVSRFPLFGARRERARELAAAHTLARWLKDHAELMDEARPS